MVFVLGRNLDAACFYALSYVYMTTTRYIPTKETPETPTVKSYIYSVVIEPDEDRYYAEVPALPECYSWGFTYEEALRNIKEAARLVINTRHEDGEPIPNEDPGVLRRAPITIGVVL